MNLDADLGPAASSDELVRKVELAVKIKERHLCYKFFVRAGAIISILFSLFLIYNETALIFGNTGSAIGAIDVTLRDKIWVIFLGTVLMLSFTVFVSFLTIFKL